jgi:thiol-disulfide isomerase/thioredoxin
VKPEAEGIRLPELPVIPWIPSLRLAPGDLAGLVVLVHFWDSTCLPCLRALPWVSAWHERYRESGLLVLGVYTPEFLFGQDDERARAFVERQQLRFPVGLDLERRLWDLFHNRYWPSRYLFDAEGRMRDYHFGAGDYATCEAAMREALHERDPACELPPALAPSAGAPAQETVPVTPELYLGLERSAWTHDEPAVAGETHRFPFPARRDPGRAHLEGPWRTEPRYLESVSTEPAAVHAAVSAAGAYALLAPAPAGAGTSEGHEGAAAEPASPPAVEVLADREPVPPGLRGADIAETASGRTVVVVGEPRLFELVRGGQTRSWMLSLRLETPGVRAYSLAFDGPPEAPPGA